MPHYLMLFRFTQKGTAEIKDSPARIEALHDVFRKQKAEVKAYYGMLGDHDTMFIVDAPDDETIARLVTLVEQGGYVTAMTHRLFTPEEFRRITSAVG